MLSEYFVFLFTMINSVDFTKRLQKIMEFYSLSASGFADTIGVPRSSISHILSGRNKPSLEFVMKVLSSFDEIDLYWLLNGKGSFPSESKKSTEQTPPAKKKSSLSRITIDKKDIDRIIIFFKDGSFKNYSN